MGITVKEGDYEILDEGVYPAVCIAVYDVGTHWQEAFSKDVHKVVIVWELKLDDGEFKYLSKSYTASLGQKANLRKELETWRGKAFTKEELEGFDIARLLGAPCMVQVIHAERNGKTYANVSAVMSLLKGVPRPEPSKKPVFFTFEEQDSTIPEGTPDWIVNMIKASREWQARSSVTLPPQQSNLEPEYSSDLEPF